MLKITRDREDVAAVRLNLFGRFTAEYIPEVKKALSSNRHRAQRLTLDLMNVTFVDRQSMEFLTAVKSQNIHIDNLPSYVTRWMQQDAGNRPMASSSAKK